MDDPTRARLDVRELAEAVADELPRRALSAEPGDYACRRDGNEAPLYGVTGAANLFMQFGFDFGGFEARRLWARRINAFQQPDGSFNSPSGLQHAASMSIIALNLLGGAPERPVRHLAPLRADRLEPWLDGLQWEGTHKDFCSAVAPVLASGFFDRRWLEVLLKDLDDRLCTDRPLETWCPVDDPPWRVISCIYHITSGLDAAYLPYPKPELLWQRLMGLDYDRVRDEIHRTACTDFDYVCLIERLNYQLSGRLDRTLALCERLFERRLAEWRRQGVEMLAEFSTHDIYCYNIGWAMLQRLLPHRFVGPGLVDTLNAPWVFRLPSRDYFADEHA